MLLSKFAGMQLVFMITITNRGRGEKISGFYTDEGVTFSLLSVGRGTVDSTLLTCLGMGGSQKDILFSIVPHELSKKLLEKLDSETRLGRPYTGIAFTVPLEYIAGSKGMHKTGGEIMEQSFEHDLIFAVVNQGFSDEVMEVAKSAKAAGGTVIHARGIGLKEAEKFFGVTIQPEKDIIMILTRRERKQEIMEAIARDAGLHTDARAFVFSVPVNGVAGLSSSPRNT